MPRSDEFPWLAACGLKACQIRGDGNCLFNSLSDQIYGDQSKNMEIRQAVVRYMRENRDTFKPFIAEEPRRNPKRKVTRGNSSRSSSEGLPEAENERIWENHLEEMEKSGTYGDNTEIQAFAKAYQVDVKVFQITKIAYYIRAQDNDAVRPIAYIARHHWEHFSSVRNIDGPFKGLPKVQAKNLPVEEDFSSNPPSPRSYSQSGRSSIERDVDSEDEEIIGPNKRRDRRLSRASKASCKSSSLTTSIGDGLQAIPTIELTEPDSNVSSQLPPPSRLPPLSKLPVKSELPDLSGDVEEIGWALSDDDSVKSISFGITAPPRITLKLNTQSRINDIKSKQMPHGPPKKVTARELKDLKKAAQKQARVESKRNNAQSQLATSTTSINQNRKRGSPPMEQVMGMKTLYI